MKNLAEKNRETCKFGGLEFVTYALTVSCDFGSGGVRVPVASRRVGMACERVPVASQYRANRFQCVQNSLKTRGNGGLRTANCGLNGKKTAKRRRFWLFVVSLPFNPQSAILNTQFPLCRPFFGDCQRGQVLSLSNRHSKVNLWKLPTTVVSEKPNEK